MVLAPETEKNAMDLVATMAAEEISQVLAINETEALGRFLGSNTARLLYKPELKLWCDGPAYVADLYFQEVR